MLFNTGGLCSTFLKVSGHLSWYPVFTQPGRYLHLLFFCNCIIARWFNGQIQSSPWSKEHTLMNTAHGTKSITKTHSRPKFWICWRQAIWVGSTLALNIVSWVPGMSDPLRPLNPSHLGCLSQSWFNSESVRSTLHQRFLTSRSLSLLSNPYDLFLLLLTGPRISSARQAWRMVVSGRLIALCSMCHGLWYASQGGLSVWWVSSSLVWWARGLWRY